MTELHPEMHERRILGTELLWAFGVGVLVAATLSMIVFTALTMNINPPSNVERIDPKALHLSGEFAEHNLGTTVAADGSVTVARSRSSSSVSSRMSGLDTNDLLINVSNERSQRRAGPPEEPRARPVAVDGLNGHVVSPLH